MRIRVLWEGKTKNPDLRSLVGDYVERISKFNNIVIEQISPVRKRGESAPLSAGERRLLEKLRGSVKVFLDPRGHEWTSEEFAAWIAKQAVRGTRELSFLAGDTEGFSAAFRGEADLLLSLSRMTLTHEWARALLLEQVYRAFTILRGFPYPR
jgi:23S rRNA (pseudouridine1915-N3)-methyltransferase